MTSEFPQLKDVPRLLMEAELKPVQGERFQATGFADLGPARYQLHDGTEMLLVESAQSMANRMELACCKDDHRSLLKKLDGLPFVRSTYKGEQLTTSYLEAHRLSSPYLLDEQWAAKLAGEMELKDDFQLNDRKIARAVFKYDPCSLIHGVWLSLRDYKDTFSGGRIRLTRALSGFVEALNVRQVESGGTKFDRNRARLETETGSAETGYGTLPFHRTEFTAEKITAYFNLDLSLLRGYDLGEDATDLLIALSLFKVRRFLSTGLRLRTACDLEPKKSLKVTRPHELQLPDVADLGEMIGSKLLACREAALLAEPPVTELQWAPKKSRAAKVQAGEKTEE